MTETAKIQARAFLKKYHLSTATAKDLRRILQSEGYTLIEFDPVYNDPDVETLIRTYHLESYIAHSKGFTYADSNTRLVFLHGGLSDEEAQIVLAHEQGHISCDHLRSAQVLGKDIIYEREANDFASYIVNPPLSSRFGSFCRRNRAKLIVCAAVLAVVAIGLTLVLSAINESKYYKNYYIAPTGNKYHTKDCGLISNSEVRRLTTAEYETGDYEPCVRCIPND